MAIPLRWSHVDAQFLPFFRMTGFDPNPRISLLVYVVPGVKFCNVSAALSQMTDVMFEEGIARQWLKHFTR